jgi:SAM-dependent methyltransferase
VFTRTYAKPHDYCKDLETFLNPIRDRPVKMLEIGCGGGESARAWLEFFSHPESKIVSLDIVKETNDFNTPAIHPDSRYSFCHGDQGSETTWACFLADFGSDWDFICDDGSHQNDHIITTFNALWPHVKSGGVYAIEDLGVDGPGSVFVKDGFPRHTEWIGQLTEQSLRGENNIEHVLQFGELAILQKKL